MGINEIEEWLRRTDNGSLWISEEACKLINLAQELIANERTIVKNEIRIVIPGIELWTKTGDTVNALSTKINDTYCVFVNKSVLENLREYYRTLNYDTFTLEEKELYVEKLVKYSWLFIVFHEYAHILCGHTEASLDDMKDKCAQEYEADMFAMDYLIGWVIRESGDLYMDELEDLYIAVYLLIGRMQKDRWQDFYDDKRIQSYYDPDCIGQRDHPLSAQRLLYLFSMFSMFTFDGKMTPLPIKKEILGKLIKLKNIREDSFEKISDNNFGIVENSIRELQKQVEEIRIKIPRRGSYNESEQKVRTEIKERFLY